MGEPKNISLGVQSNPARNQQGGFAQLINCTAEMQGSEGKNEWLIYSRDGLAPFGAPLAGGGIRFMIVADGRLFVVAGRNVYSVSSGGVSTLIGGIPTDGPIYGDLNRRIPAQIGLVSDGLYLVIDTGTNSVEIISDPDLPSPVSFATLDGFGVIPVIKAQYFITGLDQFLTIDGADFGSCEAYSDNILRNIALEREMVFLKERSLEWHVDSGDADFPFTRVHALELGCISGAAVAKVDTKANKTIIWVAPDHTVRMMVGYSGQVISTNEIEKLIRELHEGGNIAELKAFSWAAGGRYQYVLTCDSWTRMWNGQGWFPFESYEMPRWRVSAVTQFGSRIIGGDYQTGQLYALGEGVFTENDDHLVMTIIPPPVHAFPYSIVGNSLYVDMATGVGLADPAFPHSFEPQLMISYSKDGGYTWSTERTRSLGKLGQTARRVATIHQLGTAGSKGFTFRFRISAPVERLVVAASFDYDVEPA